MNISRKLTLLTLFLSFSLGLYTQEYIYDVQYLNVEEGLPDRRVINIIQDKKGFIWVSTPGAVSRYDGYQFKTYNASFFNIAESSSVYMVVDENNHIWYSEIGYKTTNSGIFDTEKDTIYTFEDYTNGLLQSEDIKYLSTSKQDKETFMIATKQGEVYHYKEGTFKLIHQTNFTYFIKVEQAADGSYWIITDTTVIRVDEDTSQTFESLEGLNIMLQQGADILIEFHKEDWYYKKFKEGQLLPVASLPGQGRIIEEKNGYKGFTLADQLILQYKKDSTAFLIKDIMPGCKSCKINLTTSMVDNQDNLWLATEDGLFKITSNRNPFQVIERNNSIRGIQLIEDWLWVGGYVGNKRHQLKTGESEEFFTKPSAAAFGYYKDKEDHIWMAAVDLLRYAPNELTPHFYPYNKRAATCLFYNPTSDRLLVGMEKGIGYFDKELQEIALFSLPYPSEDIFVRQIFSNDKGIWIVSNNGLFLLDHQTEELLHHYTTADGLPTDHINHIHEDSLGIFWLATKRDGLVKWDLEKNTFKQYSTADGLSNNTIYAVYEDDYENLWLPSNYGLICFNKKTASTKVFLPKHGIAHVEFNTYSHFQDKEGKLYFGGLDGVTIFHPKEVLQMQEVQTPLVLTDIRVLKSDAGQLENISEAYKEEGYITLKHTDRFLEISFSLLDYNNSSTNQYAYQIKGYQDQWIYIKENKISLTKIPYGNYELIIKGRGTSGNWSQKILNLPLKVQTPFYKKWWFALAIIAFSIGLIIWAANWRIRKLEKDRKQLATEVEKRTEQIEKDKQIILAQSEELKELDKAKTKFFSNITHEFRTPLTLIIGSTEQLLKEAQQEQHKKQYRVLKNAKHLLGLVNQLLDLSKLEVGRMKLDLSRGDIVRYTGALVEQLEPMALRKQQRLAFLKSYIVWNTIFDKDKWDKIIFNLVSNAIKFTPEGGAIQLCLRKISQGTEEWINLEIKDTGRGIAKDQLNNVFNRFYQIDDSSTRDQEGTGIGLALVKELVELQHGEIRVTSEIGKGTSFEIKIPVPLMIASVPDLKELTPSKPLISIPIPAITPSTTISPNKELLKLLIVEDNEDMRAYIKECIGEQEYQIIESSNGKEGLLLAKEEVPDLIISDVMMPIMDGYQLTQAIRTNLSTSHIPIVLLTAKASLESRLEGFQRGADAYLNKPFSVEELKLRVAKLIEIRQLLQLRYSSETYIRPESSNNTFAKEDAFVNELKIFITENLTKGTMNGETLGRHFGMSRMQLHRKLKALTNQTTSEFVNNIRLEKALHLLQENQYNISEVAYQSGFSSPKYFSKVFKDKFGKSPSNFGTTQ